MFLAIIKTRTEFYKVFVLLLFDSAGPQISTPYQKAYKPTEYPRWNTTRILFRPLSRTTLHTLKTSNALFHTSSDSILCEWLTMRYYTLVQIILLYRWHVLCFKCYSHRLSIPIFHTNETAKLNPVKNGTALALELHDTLVMQLPITTWTRTENIKYFMLTLRRRLSLQNYTDTGLKLIESFQNQNDLFSL